MGALNNCNRLTFIAPAKPAGTLHDVVVSGVTLPQGYFVNFTDVPDASPFAPFVEKMVRLGITVGVGGGNYGVNGNVTRDQMAVFLMKAKYGPSYAPPPATGTIFADVPAGYWAAAWIEQMYLQGITGGCATGPLRFCPTSPVTREQMAVFLLRAEHGPGYVAPGASGIFIDMPIGGPFTPWAEQMKKEGISEGTGPNTFGPALPVTRAAMAIFLDRAFNWDYYRLAQQATWGNNETTLARIRLLGVQGWLNEQFFAATSGWPILPTAPDSQPQGCGAANSCAQNHYTMYLLQKAFFQKAMLGADQLRQRTVWALHQLWVVGGRDPINLPFWMDGYLRLLDAQPFGSFRTLMEDMTLHPTMGRWLDMVTSTKNAPNENYAREILQLFCVGTQKLYIDGTPELDGQGNPVDTYDQSVVDGFTRVFTGWRFAPDLALEPGSPPCGAGCDPSPTNYRDPMVLNNNLHDTFGGQVLLDGFVMPTGLSAAQEMDIALDNVFNHPTVGPFVARHMIQQLVTANPSPGYIWRVAEVFNNDGGFTRGNMYKVVEAVLLDPEARGGNKTSVHYGKLKEPALYWTNILRAFNAHAYNNPAASSDGVMNYTTNFTPTPASLEQDIVRPLTVFNYYPLDYLTPGTTDHSGGVFGIYNANTSLRRANLANQLVLGCQNTTSTTPNCPTIGFPISNPSRPFGTSLNFAPWIALATSSGGNTMYLVEELDRYLMHGTMSPEMKNSIVTAVNALSPTNYSLRARTAIWMVLTAAQYNVGR
jgi:uncharacterized protein (DUF1800 family)